MTKNLNSFDRLNIANPCAADWQQMAGNDRLRHCAECNKNVYNLSAMTRDEAEALVARMESRLCARFERQPDGTILTAATPAGTPLISRRVSPVATVLVTAILGLSGNAFAAASLQTNEPAAIHAQSKADKANDKQDGPSFPLSGTVYDAQGAVIVGATVRLVNEAGGNQRLTLSADDGTFRFAALPAGAYTLMVTAGSFSQYQKANINVRAGQVLGVDVTMEAVRLQGDVAEVPSALRALYQQSNQIVVARIGKSVPVKKNAQNSMYKTALEVSVTLKGNNQKKTLYLYHWGWGEDQTVPGGYRAGDTVLAFLKPRVEENGYEIVDNNRGLKKLPEADLRVYRQRINELSVIMASAKPDPAAIVDWLVRCAENPATRWEGAYEIVSSVRRVADDAEEEDEAVDTDEDEDSSPDEEQGMAAVNQANPDADQQADEEDGTCTLADSDSKLAKLLTDAQKERLKTALFNTDTLAERDRELIEVVHLWHDARLVPFLVAQLHRMEADPPEFAEVLIQTIADEMKDETISQLATAYIDNVTVVDVADEDSNDEDDEDADKPEVTASVADDEKAEAEIVREQQRITLRKFLALVEKKLAH